MKIGIAASKGYAIGRVAVKKYSSIPLISRPIKDPEIEKKRLKDAIEKSKKQLDELRIKAEKEFGSEKAQVFESHIMLLDDPGFTGVAMKNISLNKINSEKALRDVMDMYISIFKSLDYEYMRERATDIKDVGDRILANLAGKNLDNLIDLDDNTIIASHDLTPSDTVMLDKKKVIGFMTDIGGITSHTAIMARTLEIPAVVGLKDVTKSVKDGDMVIIDGVNGIVFINPDEHTIALYKNKKASYDKAKSKLKMLINKPTVTRSGKIIKVAGNIVRPEDIHQVLECGGDGVGLFRTEFLYMNRENLPSEEEQFQAYKYVTANAGGKSVVVRTLDIGGDKKLSYFPTSKEVNPVLGYRAIRICLDRKDIFKIQLRAILRASAFGNLKIIFPMISSLDELLESKKVLHQCMNELKEEGKKFNENIEVGMMVELPAAAICADEFAKHVDFFSIGTNDLIQYTLAVDRMNEKISYLYNPKHPAILRLIKMTIDAAHKEGKLCGMCGESAGDEKMIPIFLEYGLDEFSMNASSILKAKYIIMNS